MKKNILLTGGTGYVATHTCLELIKSGFDVILFDNLSNSKEACIKALEKATGVKPKFVRGDIGNMDDLDNLFNMNSIDAVIHFAGYKSVRESVIKPMKYYKNNLIGSLNLLSVMKKYNVFKMIFSSSCTVYGSETDKPISEDAPCLPKHAYGKSKFFIENFLKDISLSNKNWRTISLRYFNPCGADESGLIGEDPIGIPTNLMPYITQVATKKLKILSIFGRNYETKDGTAVRDYIHVSDIASGHVLALKRLELTEGSLAINLGSGIGYSVLDIVNTFQKTTDIEIPYKFIDRAAGDASIAYASVKKAKKILQWEATKNLEDMCKDAWNFQKKNPEGY